MESSASFRQVCHGHYNGQQTMLQRKKRLTFLPDSRQCELLNYLSLFCADYFATKTLINTVENETLLQNNA